jgi:6-phosphogluconate dehydrogenase
MEIGFIGLGKMGLNMVTRLQQAGHHVTAYDRAAEALAQATTAGCSAATSIWSND